MSQNGANQKLKLLYLSKILQERTDGNHSMTMPEIIAALAEYDVCAERKMNSLLTCWKTTV